MIGWRFSLWLRRLVPHTPFKRVGYAALLALCTLAGWFAGVGDGALAALAVVVVRLIDVRIGRRGLGRVATDRGYFFEGHDHRPPRK